MLMIGKKTYFVLSISMVLVVFLHKRIHKTAMLYASPEEELMALEDDSNAAQTTTERRVTGEPMQGVGEDKLTSSTLSNKETKFCELSVRRQFAQQQCQKYPKLIRGKRKRIIYRTQNIFVDDKLKLAYCLIYKVASTSMKNYFLRIHTSSDGDGKARDMGRAFGRVEFMNLTGVRLLYEYSEAERQHIIENYFKFVVVRHPLDRLRSCWVDRVARPKNNILSEDLPDILDSLGSLGTSTSQNISFPDFLHLISKKYHDGFFNRHWVTYDEQCGVCEFPYDHIMRTETIETDSQILLQHLHAVSMTTDVTLVPPLIHYNAATEGVGLLKLRQLKHVYQNISSSVVWDLLDVYKKDMNVFGYRWNEETGATCSVPDNTGQFCC